MAIQQPLTDGYIYFWRYTEERDAAIRKHRHDPYWCKSRIAIVRNGLLIDTYWSDQTSDRAIGPDEVDADFKGNEATLRKINHWETDYYEPDDIIDTRHANHSGAPVYVKSDAARSKARILEHLAYKRERAESAIRSANWDIERIDKTIADVTAGNLECV